MAMLKGLVITMGVLIVVAMAALAYGLYHKAANPDFKLFAISGPPASFGDVRIAAPPDCVIVTSEIHDGRLYLRLGASERLASRLGIEARPNCERIIVLDATTGRTIGTFSLEAAP